MKSLCLIFLLSISAFTLYAQDELYFSKASSKLFTRDELREIIKQSAYEAVKSNHVPRAIFESNYAPLEYQLLVTGRPRIMQAIRWIESSGHSSKEKEMALYKKELYRAVRDVVLSNSAFESLAVVDQADRILKFHSDVKVHKDGTLDVTELITIYNGDGRQSDAYKDSHPNNPVEVNDDIKHGLQRNFPTHYKGRLGLNEIISFDVYDVQVNGRKENYQLYEHDNGASLRIGSADVYLPDGIYEYEIKYHTRHQLIFHPAKDELFWNVNGTSWVFTADSVSSRITFPAGAKIFEQACYTGVQDSKAKECTGKIINDSTIVFTANSRLNSFEGLSVAAAIQKGILLPPSQSSLFIRLMKDNWPIPAMIGVLLFMLAINMNNWFSYGKDPAQGTIIPRFEPPNDIWVADAGYIYNQEYKPQQFSAALVDLAVKKGINIVVGKEGILFKSNTYTFTKGTNTHNELFNFAVRAYNWDLRDLYGLTASGKYNSDIGALNGKLSNHLESKFRADSDLNEKKEGLFSWNARAGSWGFYFLFFLGFATLVFLSSIYVTTVLALVVTALFAIGFIMQYVFYKIMPAYTKDGQRVRDELLGFRMYLSTAEERRFDALSLPEKDLKLFERFLPYAIALECQNEWSRKFESILNEAIANDNYHPTYYSGTMSRDMSFSSISDGISSGLSGTIASASTAPSSGGGGGGSSGGGSSGGGGGGGGGGGW